MKKRPIGLDLFAGAGGLSLGFEQAGFTVEAAVEIDPIHAATHLFNFPLSTVFPQSVTDISGDAIRELSGIGSEEVDVVFGGAPCQGFSLIGQRALDDPRNRLVREFLRLVLELDAKYFVFENVKGLTLGKHRQFLNELIEEFQNHGYEILLPWQVLNAAHYYVPQNRERFFLIGAKRGCCLPDYPQPVSADVPNLLESFLPTPSCEDALSDLPEVENYDELTISDSVVVDSWKSKSEYAKLLHCESQKAWHYGFQRKWNSSQLTSSMRTKHTDISRRRFSETKEGEVEPISRFFKLARKGISNTLRAGTDSARGAFTSPRPVHYARPRCITVREMARLHGYPDWFRFHRTKWHGARQVGNSVPPPLARSIASAILSAMETKPTKPRKKIDLGDPFLLTLDMTRAARYFGVDISINKRDRKSGAKKRKQIEIEKDRLLAKERV